MTANRQNDDCEPRDPYETEQRLRQILRGAFSGPPTPLKAVPTRHGKERTQAKPGRTRIARATPRKSA